MNADKDRPSILIGAIGLLIWICGAFYIAIVLIVWGIAGIYLLSGPWWAFMIGCGVLGLTLIVIFLIIEYARKNKQ